MLKLRFIGRDMTMEFRHPEQGVVRTSRVRDIRQWWRKRECIDAGLL